MDDEYRRRAVDNFAVLVRSYLECPVLGTSGRTCGSNTSLQFVGLLRTAWETRGHAMQRSTRRGSTALSPANSAAAQPRAPSCGGVTSSAVCQQETAT